MKVVYWTCQKDGFTIGGYARSLIDAEQAAKQKVGLTNYFWKREYNYTTQLQKFDDNLNGFIQLLEIAHSAGRLAERQSYNAARGSQDQSSLNEKTALKLRMDGLSIRDIAQTMSLSIGKVHRLISKAAQSNTNKRAG